MDNYWSEWCAKWMDSNIDIIMADFNSKYTGEQVEQLLDQVASGNAGGGGGGITVETDPIFSASPAATITEEKIAEWNKKVDKVDGKQLSTEDFTTLLKQKLDGLNNYDDTEIENAITSLQTQFNTLVSGNASDAINSFNEIIAFLDGVKDTENLASIISSIEQQIAGKMDKVTLATVATSGSYNDLADKPTIPDVSNKQDKLVSGSNIKTINGNSLLGSGDIVISGGGGGSVDVSGKQDKIRIVKSDDLQMPFLAEVDTYYYVRNKQNFGVTITLPFVSDENNVHEIVVNLFIGEYGGVYFVTLGGKSVLASSDFTLEAGNRYEIYILYNGSNWVVSAIRIIISDISSGGSGGSSN